ncbi:MBL fold metallo-hydrolase [Parasphingorhabdus sp.]|uniref:MBL fold metallo-hydrolase n=1 Tax=Parasphingorhabdus sp. TaxID=2709688 RepID=UPI003D2D2FBF
MKKLLKILKWIAILALSIGIMGGLLAWYLHTDISEERERRMQSSEHFVDRAFVNQERQAESDLGMEFMQEQFFGDQQREPEGSVPVISFDPAQLQNKADPGLRTIWLGHASVLVEIDGYRILTDPVLSQRVSPFQFLGPKRTHQPPLPLEQWTAVDAVVISHNHYDHLDEATVRHLAAQGTKFFVPLGVGQYFEDWNIPSSQVVEMEWWQSEKIGALTIIATPNRHYSSRGLLDYKATHWSSWSISGPTHKVFYSGDSGYSKLFSQIGERLGPFDLNIIKVGAYGPGQAWADIHMTPEEAIQVHLDIGGKRMLPVHWMTFNLALHDWDEPIKRALTAAERKDVAVVTPKIGEIVHAGQPFLNEFWWDEVD